MTCLTCNLRIRTMLLNVISHKIKVCILGIDLVFVQQLVYRELLTRLTANADDPQYIIVIFQAFE